MSDSMIERVALAIKANFGKQWDAKPLPSPMHKSDDWSAIGEALDLEEVARAAIKAMREPTKDMQNAWCEVIFPPLPWDQDSLAVWRAMIDAALEGK